MEVLRRLGGGGQGKRVVARREAQIKDWGLLSSALRSLADGEDTDDAIAARGIIAETILLHRKWLEGQFKKAE